MEKKLELSPKKIVIWGFPLNSHTHSYVHYGWFKAFSSMFPGNTFWFHDGDHPAPDAFDYTNCLFITEGYADKQVPLDPTNVYMVHVCVDPKKYLSIGARLIDIRYHVSSINDCNYSYNLDDKLTRGVVVPINFDPMGGGGRTGPMSCTLYEAEATSTDLAPRHRSGADLSRKYEAVYIYWATDLLPEEINLEDRFTQPKTPFATTFIGSISDSNRNEIERLRQGCAQLGIGFNHVNPWSKPVTFEEGRRCVLESVVAPDIRGSGDPYKMASGDTGTAHKATGYIPCRLFKNISYGRIGAINCKRVRDLFGDLVVYHEDEAELVKMCFDRRQDYEFVKRQMEWVRDNHTYINRVQDVLAILGCERPT
jgi:hypothetical protein